MKRNGVYFLGFLAIGLCGAYVLTQTSERPPTSAVGQASASGASTDLSEQVEISSSPVKTTKKIFGRPDVLRADPKDQAALRDVNIRDSLPDLLEAAKNDASLSYALALTLQKCSFATLAEESLADESDRLSEEVANTRASALIEANRPCDGLTDTLDQEQFELIEAAAEKGILEAQIHYRALAARYVSSEAVMRQPGLLEQYKRNSIRHAMDAASTGDPEALYNAYDILSSDLFGPPDAVNAHAYLHAYILRKPSRGGSFLLSESRKNLSAQELLRAELVGRSLSR